MTNREITLWIDDRLADELEKVLPGHDVQKAMEDKLAELTSLVPAQTLNAICREIDSENERIAREAEARRRFSALKVTEDGRDSFIISEDGTNQLCLSRSIRDYLSKGGDAPFVPVLHGVRESDAAEFRAAIKERMEGTGRVVGVFMVDVDAGKLSALDTSGGWHTYKFRDLSTAAYAAWRKDQQRTEKRQEIFDEKLRGKELTPVAEGRSPTPMMAQTI